MLMMDQNTSRPDLKDIPTPEPTKTWRPVSHYALAQALIVEAQNLGLKLHEEAWRVEDGAMYPKPGEKVVVPGARLYGTLDFEAPDEMDRTIVPSIGIIHANDQSAPMTVFFGAHVMICENGVRTGEFTYKRKHTSGLDIDHIVETVFARMKDETARVQMVHRRMQGLPLTTDQADLLAVKSARAGAFSSSQILQVVREFDCPSYEDFGKMPRSLWRFYNASTHIMKKQSVGRQGEAFEALNKTTFPLIKAA